MHIILEGPDASGKSTLARALGYKTIQSEGPEKYPKEILERIERYQKIIDEKTVVVFDRHPCVSHPIYSSVGGNKYQTSISMMLIAKAYHNALIVYCRSPNDQTLLNHNLRAAVDSESHLRLVYSQHSLICKKYDEWALRSAHIIYRVGHTSMEDTASLIKEHINVRSGR